MSRDGFPVADIDVGLLDDPKVRALVRRLAGDEAAVAMAMMIYTATVLGSWAEGARLCAEEAAPLWIHSLDPSTEALVSVGLLDQEHRLPAHSWASWFDPAAERREVRLERWRRANRKRRRAATASSPRGNREATEATDRPTGRDHDGAALDGAPSGPPTCERCGQPRHNGEQWRPVLADGRTLWAHVGDCPPVIVEATA